MKPSILAAGLAACALAAAAPASAQDILTPYGHINLRPGESLKQAIDHAALLDSLKPANPTGAATKHVAPQAGNAAPTITSGAMLSNTLTVGSAGSVPAMQFDYNAGPAGFSAAVFTFVSPNGQNAIDLPFYAGAYSRKAKIVFAGQSGVPYFAEPGPWTLTTAYIGDYANNSTTYDAAQIAALIENPVLNVVNTGPVDTTPPVITSGTILTPTVSLSAPVPIFEASLGGTDDLSGVAYGLVVVQGPGEPYGVTELQHAPIVFTKGSMEVSVKLLSGSKHGKWQITALVLCDVAANCVGGSQTPAEIKALLGTTTFEVTK